MIFFGITLVHMTHILCHLFHNVHHRSPVSADQSTSIFDALLSQTLPVVNICSQPVATRCSSVGPSLLLVRRPGTRGRAVYETWHVLSTAFGMISRLFFSQATCVHRMLEASWLCTIQIYDWIHTWQVTSLKTCFFACLTLSLTWWSIDHNSYHVAYKPMETNRCIKLLWGW